MPTSQKTVKQLYHCTWFKYTNMYTLEDWNDHDLTILYLGICPHCKKRAVGYEYADFQGNVKPGGIVMANKKHVLPQLLGYIDANIAKPVTPGQKKQLQTPTKGGPVNIGDWTSKASRGHYNYILKTDNDFHKQTTQINYKGRLIWVAKYQTDPDCLHKPKKFKAKELASEQPIS